MRSFPFDIVGFDLDGTLLDTSADLGHALNHVLTTIGRPAVPIAEARRFIGGGTGQMLRGALTASGGFEEADIPAWQDQMIAYYKQNIARHTRLFPGGEAMLDALAARGVTLAVATNKREALAMQLFEELGLASRFATIIGGDTLGLDKAKPAPDMLHEMVARCGGGRAAFVGDTTFDVGAARAAQMPVIAVRFGFCDLPPDRLGANRVIDHFDELIPALEALG
ncbi:HAD family hydrolase [Novosphingobium sp. Chol11]|uniref:HAD family hydrolase n=1 Tax=Novosphingobium sp. Chol11 TaxID=1385763 RepID=UPI0025D60806|nr:HAD hydrolase-like protein [Novosphingobium sp. Chol11]